MANLLGQKAFAADLDSYSATQCTVTSGLKGLITVVLAQVSVKCFQLNCT